MQPKLTNDKETLYLILLILVSVALYVVLIVSLVGLVYLLLGFLILFVIQGVFIGYVRGNCVRLGEDQFPEVYGTARDLAAEMGLKTLPEIYLMESGGLLNALATRFVGKHFVILYSELFELVLSGGEAELKFILAHEFGHVRCRHLIWNVLLYPGLLVPFLGHAYRRACEYTADRNAAHFVPEGAVGGLVLLAAGRNLYRKVNKASFVDQVRTNRGFWVWLAEMLSTHPNLPKRVAAVEQYLGAGALKDRYMHNAVEA